MLKFKCTIRLMNILIVIVISLVTVINSSETQHKTKAASEKQHDLWCHRCDTMVDGERCLDLAGNLTSMHIKCSKEQKKCQVKRISMSTSTDEITGKPRLWLLQRNCSETCEPSCIVIGERTKLHSCITCCDEHNYCNAGSGSEHKQLFVFGLLITTLVLLSAKFIMKEIVKYKEARATVRGVIQKLFVFSEKKLIKDGDKNNNNNDLNLKLYENRPYFLTKFKHKIVYFD